MPVMLAAIDPAVLLRFTIVGVVTGAIYAIGAAGLVLTYTTTGVFNFAHGAVGMVAAFAYWQLRVGWNVPGVVALVATLLVVTPMLALAIESLMRRFRNADVTTVLVITIGLMVTMIGAIQRIFPPATRTLPPLISDGGPRLGGVVVSWDQLTILAIAAIVAVSLRILLYGTRLGVTMRAVVDDPGLAALNGARPASISQMAWIAGSVLAALAGILVGPAVGLEAVTLTFLVVNAYAAAMAGRLTSLPLTFVGAIALGLLQSYYDFAVLELDLAGVFQRIKPAIPTLFLFGFLLALPGSRLRAYGAVAGSRLPPLPSVRRAVTWAGVLVVAALVVAPIFPERYLGDLTRGVLNALLMLSLVVLTGYSGLLSLGQLVFVGLGAWAMAVAGGGGSVLGLAAAVAVAAPVGAVVALPSLRLKGLYLALSTFAFAVLANALIFQDPRIFGRGNREIARPSLFGFDASGDKAFFVLAVVVFAVVGFGVVALRRSATGRRLAAMRDSEAACSTLGLHLRNQKLAIFALSAAIAGLAGALLGGQKTTFGGIDVEVFGNLPLVLLAVIGGVTTVSGALLAGLLLAGLPLVQSEFPEFSGLAFGLIGVGAIALGKQANGLVGMLSDGFRDRRDRFLAGYRQGPVHVVAKSGSSEPAMSSVSTEGS